jgi:hypothetical protein
LATHPEIGTIGERRKFFAKSIVPNDFGAQTCSCGEKFVHCPFWSEVRQEFLKGSHQRNELDFTEFQLIKNKRLNQAAFRSIDYFIKNKLPLKWHPLNTKIQENIQLNEELVQIILTLAQADVFLDSSKSMQHALFLSLVAKFDLRIIWLVRDPRAQVNSALKYNKWTVRDATQRWIEEMNYNRIMLEKINARSRIFRYEDLCVNPESTLKQIGDFVEMDPEGFTLDFRSQTQHIMGNYSMRRGSTAEVKERLEWKTTLGKEQIELIEKLTSDFQQYYS